MVNDENVYALNTYYNALPSELQRIIYSSVGYEQFLEECDILLESNEQARIRLNFYIF